MSGSPPPQIVIVQNPTPVGCLHGGCANLFWFAVVLGAVLVAGVIAIAVFAH